MREMGAEKGEGRPSRTPRRHRAPTLAGRRLQLNVGWKSGMRTGRNVMNRRSIMLAGTTVLGLAIAALPQIGVAQTVAPPVDSLTSFVEQERGLLARFHMIPIVVPRGERVGNSYDRETSILITNTDDCFPKLQIRKDHGQLPSMTAYSEQGLAAALGAGGIADAEGGTSSKRVYVLSFRDVEVQNASVVALRTRSR